MQQVSSAFSGLVVTLCVVLVSGCNKPEIQSPATPVSQIPVALAPAPTISEMQSLRKDIVQLEAQVATLQNGYATVSSVDSSYSPGQAR